MVISGQIHDQDGTQVTTSPRDGRERTRTTTLLRSERTGLLLRLEQVEAFFV
jgi:hypothetical protein